MFRNALIISLFLSVASFAKTDIANSSRILEDIHTQTVVLKSLIMEYKNAKSDEYREYLEKLIQKQRDVINHLKAGA